MLTSGLLLLTTDGDAVHRLMHPRFEVPRTYRMGAHGLTEPQARAAFARRIVIDGRPVNIERAQVRAARGGRRGGSPPLEFELTLAEGRHRIVRRLAEQLGLKVEWLHRISYGPVSLGSLAEGAHRALTDREIREIERLHGTA